jgi:hypothetical protein
LENRSLARVALQAREDHWEVRAQARHGVTDREFVVVGEMDVEQHRVRVMSLDGLLRPSY